jgi:putative solute:sodium symporter small subunit
MDKPTGGRAAAALHWRKTRAMSALLLLLWFLTTFCTVFFARELASLTLFGWPMSFYMAAQGSALIHLAVLAFYAWRMRRLDKQYRRQLAGDEA